MKNQYNNIQLGNSDIIIKPLGIGTWAWGSSIIWEYGKDYKETDLFDAFQLAIDKNIKFFDTAEFYGNGNSEKLLGNFRNTVDSTVFIASKFMPYPWRLTKNSLINALQKSLERLNLDQLDLYQIHWPFPPVPIETWANALADAFDKHLIKTVGVSNYNTNQMLKAHNALQKRGIHLASNQVEYSLLNRKVEFNGLLKTCQELNITLIAYSPLAQGLLTGKYLPTNPPKGLRKLRFSSSTLKKIQPLIEKLKEIGNNHNGKTPTQVSLNWLINKGALPIPGVKNKLQAIGVIESLDFKLSDEEIEILDKISNKL